MHIIAIAWIYVVSMMAVTELTVMAAIMTLTFYCVIPLGIVWFITARTKRRFVKPKDNLDQKNQEGNSSKSDEKMETNN